MILVTGASGQLGRLVIEQLLSETEANNIIAAVRSPEKVANLAERGVVVRQADYNDPASLISALEGVDKLLLISSSEVGNREAQHANVINAAKEVGVAFIAYTSLLHADTSPLTLAAEHKATEALLAESGLDYCLLRNGWYSENYTASIPAALQFGVMIGCAGNGKISSTARADYAAAAAKVMLSDDQVGKVYELAGDESYSLEEFAAVLSEATGKDIGYQNLPESAFQGALLEAGLPEPLAVLLAESDTGAAKGGLFDDSKTLSKLIGRNTTSIKTSINDAL